MRCENADLRRQLFSSSSDSVTSEAQHTAELVNSSDVHTPESSGITEVSNVPPNSHEPSSLPTATNSDKVPPQQEMEGINSDVSPPHSEDIKRAKRLSIVLETLHILPDHVNTLVLGDSNTHKVLGKDVDPKANKVCVRSFSGLCIFAAALALMEYDKTPYEKIKKLVWSVGVNDALHGDTQHCLEDNGKQITLLFQHSKRIFPNAQVHFILPFTGGKAVTPSYRKELEQRIKENTPDMKMHFPPNMSKMMLPDGVHINSEGKQAYINFLRQRFSKRKPSNTAAIPDGVASVPPLVAQPGAQSAQFPGGRIWESFRIPPHDDGYRSSQPPVTDFSELARGISDALCRTLQTWSSQQLRQQNEQLYSWPRL